MTAARISKTAVTKTISSKAVRQMRSPAATSQESAMALPKPPDVFQGLAFLPYSFQAHHRAFRKFVNLWKIAHMPLPLDPFPCARIDRLAGLRASARG